MGAPHDAGITASVMPQSGGTWRFQGWGNCESLANDASGKLHSSLLTPKIKQSGGKSPLRSAKTARIPPGTKQINTCRKIIGELIFARMHAGPVFALTRIQKIVSRDHFPRVSQILEGIHLGAIHVAPVSAPVRIQEILLANYLCI